MTWSCCACDCQNSSEPVNNQNGTGESENWKVLPVDVQTATAPKTAPDDDFVSVETVAKLKTIEEEKEYDQLEEEIPQIRPREYNVELEWTDSRSASIVFDLSDSRVPVVLSIEQGLDFDNWNTKCPSKQVEAGHGLISVNGEVRSGAEMVAKLKEPGHVALTFKLPLIRTVKLAKRGRPLGFFLARTGTGLVVESVTSGGTAAQAGIRESDRIVAVNDREGGPMDLNDMIRKCEELEVRLASYMD